MPIPAAKYGCQYLKRGLPTPGQVCVQETLRNSAKPTKYIGQHSTLQAIAFCLILLVSLYCSIVNYACLIYQDLCVSSELF